MRVHESLALRKCRGGGGGCADGGDLPSDLQPSLTAVGKISNCDHMIAGHCNQL